MEHFIPFEIDTCEVAGSSNKNSYPLVPDLDKPFHPFRIQDPFGLRNAIVPVFREDTSGRIYGLGTAFNTNQFGVFLTAHHVIDFVEYTTQSRPLLFLSMHALGYGTTTIPDDCFVPVSGVHFPTMDSENPFAQLLGKPERKVAMDLAVLQASALGPGVRQPQTLKVRVNDWQPKVGEMVLAIGYSELDLSELGTDAQSMLLTEGMYGAYGEILEVYPCGVGSANPSPVFLVDTEWPSGMSGGPVFNRAGEVIGIVSRSVQADVDLPGRGFAVDLGRSHEIQVFAPNLDAPGWQVCWGLFLENGSDPISVHASDQDAAFAADSLERPYSIKKIANEIGTKNWMGA